jgi:PAS domain S-box-containing protein
MSQAAIPAAHLVSLLDLVAAFTFECAVDAGGTPRAIRLAGAFEHLLGESPGESFPAWGRLIPPDDRPVVDRWLAQLLENQPAVCELRIVRAGGQVRWVRVAARPIWSDHAQRVTGFFGAVSDISDQKAAEEALDESRRQREREADELRRVNRTLQAFVHSDQAVLRATDEGGYLQDVCRIIVEDCGYAMVWVGLAEHDEARTVRPVAWAGFEAGYLETLQITWADTERGRGPTGTAIRTGRTSVCGNILTDPRLLPWRAEAVRRGYAASMSLPLIVDGGVLGALTIYFQQPGPLPDDEVRLLEQLAGDFARGIQVLRLRAARTRAEEDLAHSEERYRRLVDLTPDALFVNRGDRVVFVNPAGVRLFGASAPGEILGRSPLELFHPDSHDLVRGRIRELLSGGIVPPVEEKILRLDGTTLDVESAASSFYDRDGLAIQVVLHDITGRKRGEERLRAVNERLMEADRRKDEFLSTLSHELRTPLNAVLGWAHMLLGAPPDAEVVRKGVEAIARSARAQASLINDMLDVSRIITGKMRLDTHPLAVAGAVEAAVDAVRPAAAGKGVDLRVDIRANPVLLGDLDRLQQVFWNLLSNAVKFTPAGGVVRVEVDHADARARVRVTDTGIGIDLGFLPHVFERFWQVDSSTHRSYSGLGLGLAIVRHLVELHGGTVTAESAGAGQGAAFTVLLPVRAVQTWAGPVPPQHDVEAAPALPPSLAGLRVMVVDDDPDARELLAASLGQCGAEVVVAGSAADALDLLARQVPDVLVSDIGMPGQDGYDLIRAVRARSRDEGGLVPAVALTAYGREEDRLQALRAGYQQHVPKPISPVELATVVATLRR